VRDVKIPGTERPTTRLGFGGSRLVAGPSKKHSLALLDAAFEAGIRHFDVAPSYGLGGAEEVLGIFLAKHRGEVTVTTKFGIPRPSKARKSLMQTARAVIKPIVGWIPGVRARLLQALQARKTAPVRFTPQEMLRSLQTSLRTLRCERVDLFLLHEAEAEDLTDEIRQALEGAVGAGLIGAWGIGSDRRKIEAIETASPAFARILQFDWSVLSESPPHYPGAYVITHHALAGAFACLKLALAEPARRHAWFERVGIDCGDDRVLSRLLLSSALDANPTGIVLFSSNDTNRIRENAAVLNNGDVDIVRRFAGLIRANRRNLLGSA
jgi:D-threo-aldose 1-dehydrogenase